MNNYIEKLACVSNSQKNPFSIETGFFIFTLMPSLRCSLNCPHCYLSKEQRKSSEIMSLDDLKKVCLNIDNYYLEKQIDNKVIILYWYGGEPTEMGIDYFTEATKIINSIFTKVKGYTIKHTILTSLLTVDEDIWFPFFKEVGEGHFQTSFDGLMRGKGYVRKWGDKVKRAIDFGLSVGTISVVNHELLKDGPKEVLNYLSDLGVSETSFLPFMWNEQNDGKQYVRFAPTMDAWSKFMIELSQEYFNRKKANQFVPEVGQLSFVLHQGQQENHFANIAGQTMFLLPNGDFVLPDYKKGFQEYLRVFGNALTQRFSDIITSKERKTYLRKQVLRNNNSDCLNCEHADKCVMEFWKDNRRNDDCFGGKKYVNWLLDYAREHNIKITSNKMY